MSSNVSGGLHTSNMLFKGAKPLVERLLGIDDNFEFSVGELANDAGILGRERNLYPFSVKAQGICHIENPADLLKRYRVKCHSYLSVVQREGILGGDPWPVNAKGASLAKHPRHNCRRALDGISRHIQMCHGATGFFTDSIEEQPFLLEGPDKLRHGEP